jgi:G:T/U-mismatch repair DNA glycosylase
MFQQCLQHSTRQTLKKSIFSTNKVLEERFKRDPTLVVQKDIDIYKSKQGQIETIEKRRTLRKAIKRCGRKKENEEDSNIRSYKQYKSKRILNLLSTTK